MPERPLVCGLDVGVTHHGVALVGTAVHYTAVWKTRRDPQACAELAAMTLALMTRHGVRLLAIEDYHGRRTYTHAERPILWHTGALLSLARTGLEVRLVPIQAWQDAIVGARPVPRRDGGTATLWKQTMRRQVTLALRARGIAWADEAPDPGGHRADALAVALYAQDLLTREGRP